MSCYALRVGTGISMQERIGASLGEKERSENGQQEVGAEKVLSGSRRIRREADARCYWGGVVGSGCGSLASMRRGAPRVGRALTWAMGERSEALAHV